MNSGSYPFGTPRNLVMVAGHSIYTSSCCEKVDQEDSWFLESYQKHPGQATTFFMHIKEDVDILGKDVASYDFKEERFADLHRSGIGFPEARFFYFGTPASSTSVEATMKGEALVRAQFSEDHMDVYDLFAERGLHGIPFIIQSLILMGVLSWIACSIIVVRLLIRTPFLGQNNTLCQNLIFKRTKLQPWDHHSPSDRKP